jgi:hypothetical protein
LKKLNEPNGGHQQQQQIKRIRKIKDAFPYESSIFDVIQANALSSPTDEKECKKFVLFSNKSMALNVSTQKEINNVKSSKIPKFLF